MGEGTGKGNHGPREDKRRALHWECRTLFELVRPFRFVRSISGVDSPRADERSHLSCLRSSKPKRGELTDRGVRNLCHKYSAICGFKLHPHLLRHRWPISFLRDLVSLAQIPGHENLNTTARYTKRTQDQLDEASDRLSD